MDNHYKEGYSLIWDKDGKYIDQSWADLKEKMRKTQGGFAVLADDFIEMLYYRGSHFREKTNLLRDSFAELTCDATQAEDIKFLSEILNYILIEPPKNLDQAGWFITLLKTKETKDFDVERAAILINRLHLRHERAAEMLCSKLTEYYVKEVDKTELIFDVILNSGKLSRDVIRTLRRTRFPLNKSETSCRTILNYPNLFISYSRKDEMIKQKVVSYFEDANFKVWVDDALESGTPQWEVEIENAIRNAGAVIVIMSPHSKTSTWVKNEIKYAEFHKIRIFLILAIGEESESIPISLVNIQWIDIRENFDAGMASLKQTIEDDFAETKNESSNPNEISFIISE